MNTATVQTSIADRLGSTLFLAALAHGVVILGITFTAEPLPDTEALPSLNVTLLIDSRESERSLRDAQFLAERAQRGGGRLEEGRRATTALSANHPTTQAGDRLAADLEDGTPRERTAQAEQLLARSLSETATHAPPQPTDDPANVPMKAAALIQQLAPQSLAAEIDVEAKVPRSDASDDLASPSTRESALAAYLVGWRQRVERIGTANFPQRFLDPRRDFGRPTLEVAIGAEGHLEDIVVRRSSGDTTLDQAALKILRLAAPFEPLPASILAEYDVLRFAYDWDFSSSQNAAAGGALTASD